MNIFYTKNDCLFLSVFELNSSILLKNESFPSQLHRFLAPAVGNDSHWLLCYRASLHGWDASAFHQQCDGKTNTVTMIEKDQYVFGGYTDTSWGKYIILTGLLLVICLRTLKSLSIYVQNKSIIVLSRMLCSDWLGYSSVSLQMGSSGWKQNGGRLLALVKCFQRL